MKITIHGKAHLEGVSKKSGKEYSFNQIHYLAPARGVEGVAAKTLNLDPVNFPLANIIVGREYEIQFDDTGYPVVFQPIQK